MRPITLLDGAIGQELVARSGDRATPLWSTAVMMDQPELVADLHADYFRAGATVATANTYAVHRDRLARAGLEDRHLDLLDCATDAACAARDAHGAGRVAVSLGPLAASYRPDIVTPPEQASEAFGQIVARLDGHADLFLIETAASLNHAEGALRGCAGATKPVWLGVTVDDEDGTRLRSGEALADLAPLIARHDPAAVLINCSRPEAVSAGMPVLAGFGRPFGGYANGFTHISDEFLTEAPTVDALQARRDLGPETYADAAMGWIAMGATIVGGCCEVGPDHIATLARRLRDAGHAIE